MQILSNKNLFGLIFLILALSQAVNAAGPAAVNLGSAGNFVILAKSGVSTTGTTSIVGDIGASPIDHTAITGFGLSLDPSGQFATSSLVTGKLYASDYSPPTPTTMTTAISDMQTAYTDAAGRTSPTATELGAGNIGGLTLAPGLYKWGTGVTIPTDVTLNGSATDVWIFQIAQTLDISSGKKVLLSGGAQASNIFWQVAGQTTLGTTSVFNGIILGQTAIVLNNGATLNGRALAQTAVTMDANIVSAAVSSANSTAPTITLNAPGNGQGASTSSKNVTFNWTATDPLYLNLTCNFSVDGAVNRSNLAAVNNTPFTTSAVVNLSEGVHTWAVSCWDLSNNTTSSATNHFAVDLTKPAVVANAPVANANVSTSTTTFRWNATDLLSIMTCNLTIDGAVSQSSIAANNSTLTTATAPLANGIHT